MARMGMQASSLGTETDTAVRTWRALEIGRIANKVVTVNTWVQPGENVAIICDPEVSPLIVEALATQVYIAGGTPVVVTFPGQVVHGAELPEPVGAAIRSADVIYAMVSKSISHTVSVREARKAGVRYIGFSNITEDAFIRGAATEDPLTIKRIGDAVCVALTGAKDVHVASPLGTDVHFSLEGRYVSVSDSIIPRDWAPGTDDHLPDNGRMFPDGETYCCPVEESVNGAIVVDRWIQGIGVLSEPVTWKFVDGECVEITGGIEASRLNALIEEIGDQHSRKLGEFAVGINPQAREDGNPHREGKKVLGSVHFALGTGVVAGGRYQSTLHLDGRLSPPKIFADGKLFFDEGKLLV